MKGFEEEPIAFEVAIVFPRRVVKEVDVSSGTFDCVELLVDQLSQVGLVVQKAQGASHEFIKLAAPLETLGRAAAEMQMKKPTRIGMDLQFKWVELEAFVRQPDGSLFSWCERYQCYHHLIYGIGNKSKSDVNLIYNEKELLLRVGESLLRKLECEGIVKQVFPLHDEARRKMLLRDWALYWREITGQPLDDIHSYFGTKIATYFAFLGMYARWLLFPAAFGLLLQFVNVGSLQSIVLPIFFASTILWAVSFFQFWKRKISSLSERWQISSNSVGTGQRSGYLDVDGGSKQSPAETMKKLGNDQPKTEEVFSQYEWLEHLMRYRYDAVVTLSILCLQLPFELAYAYLYEIISSNIIKFVLTGLYLLAIQYYTKLGTRLSVQLIKHETNENREYRADSLVYKVFGLYFMQTYIGIFYHVLLHRNFSTLRQLLLQRLIISEVLGNLMECSFPFLKYKYNEYITTRNKKKHQGESSAGNITSRVEEDYLKPSYTASIGYDLEDGLFDDFLELALQFGRMMMFACVFPSAFAFAAMNNIIEIRTDALKLLTVFKRPVPRAAASIGAWYNIFQFLIVMSICTNSALLMWMYGHEGQWKIDRGLAAVLVLEHFLLLVKFGFSQLVPEEPAWVRASRMRNETQAQEVWSKQLFGIPGNSKTSSIAKKLE